MAHVDKTPLSASTAVGKWYLERNAGTHAAPSWVAVNGMTEFAPKLEPTAQEDRDADSGGYGSTTVTGLKWTLEAKFARKPTIADPTVYDPGQEALRTKAKAVGINNRDEVRWYEVTENGPIAEAYQAYVAVQYSEQGGAMDAIDEVALTLHAQGQPEAIEHPDYAAVVPTVLSIVPATDVEAGGAAAYITGHDFMVDGEDDVVSISFGAVDCPDYVTINDTLIAVVVPAGTGSINVNVENATGESTDTVAFIYTA